MKQQTIFLAAPVMALMFSLSAVGAVVTIQSGSGSVLANNANGGVVGGSQTNSGVVTGNVSASQTAPSITVPSGVTYNVGKNDGWANLTVAPANTRWVSFVSNQIPGNAIGNSVSAGTQVWVDFYQTFNLGLASTTDILSAQLNILADDRANVYLNGNMIHTTAQGTNNICNNGTIGCIATNEGTFTTNFKNALLATNNTLVVRVFQDAGGGFGTAYQADINVVPEPGFYGVLSLGLGGLLVALQRRRKNAAN